MKRFLLPFVLLSTIPFNTSCVKDIKFDVIVNGENCTWDKPVKKALISHNYEIKLVPDNGYILFMSLTTGIDEGIHVKTKNAGDITTELKDDLYNDETCILTIPGSYVTSEITITAIGDQQSYEQK